jgi:hypothetical protein
VIGRGRHQRPFRGIISGVNRLLALIALPLLASTPAFAQSSTLQGFAMRPPCEGAPQPAYAAPGGPPAIASWTESDLNKAAWQLSPCLRWTQGPTRMVTALAAVFHAASLDDLLARYGALSQYKAINVWSVMHQAWEPFATQAGFTDGPAATYTYPDPKPADFTAGKDFYYYEIDARTGRTIHHLKVGQRTADKVELMTENLTPITYSMFTVFQPRALRTATFIERQGPNAWGYYQAIGVGEGSDFIATHSASPYINRLTALYRYMAGLPTDGAPPAAPN